MTPPEWLTNLLTLGEKSPWLLLVGALLAVLFRVMAMATVLFRSVTNHIQHASEAAAEAAAEAATNTRALLDIARRQTELQERMERHLDDLAHDRRR